MFTPIRLISVDSECDKFGWVGSPECGRIGAMERHLIDRRSDCVIVAGVEDPNANYTYDEAAVVHLDGEYFLVQTSGCSCPLPSETWQVVLKGTLQDIRDAIQRGDYGGYTLPDAELSAFLADIEAAGKTADAVTGVVLSAEEAECYRRIQKASLAMDKATEQGSNRDRVIAAQELEEATGRLVQHIRYRNEGAGITAEAQP